MFYRALKTLVYKRKGNNKKDRGKEMNAETALRLLREVEKGCRIGESETRTLEIPCLMKRLRGDRVVLTEEGRKLLEWNN